MLSAQIDAWTLQFRSCFSRQASFKWFVLAMWGMFLRVEGEGLTSVIRCLGLGDSDYRGLLHFFHSKAFSAQKLCVAWRLIVLKSAPLLRLHDKPLFVVDGIKVGKSGRKMPAVKLLHQESEDNSKPEYLMGHYWGALSVLATRAGMAVAIPLRFQLQDGVKRSPSEKATLVDKMATLVTDLLDGCVGYVIGDRYFASRKMLVPLLSKGLHFIGACRRNTVAYLPPPPRKAGTRGRPRKRGDKVTLATLFKNKSLFVTSEIHLYGKTQKIRHHALDLWWLGVFVRFVLSVNPEGRRGIFVSTDISLTAEEILKAYGFRFKIEDGFKSFIHTMFGMSYRFWMKAMTRTKRGMGNIYLHRSGDRIRASVLRKLEAYERFTNLAAIAMGMLQLLGLTMKEAAGAGGLYFRTPPKLAMPSVLGVRCALQGEIRGIFDRNEAKPLLAQLLGEMKRAVTAPHPMKVAA